MSALKEVHKPPERRIKLDGSIDSIKLQLIIHCYINKLELSSSEIDALAKLATLSPCPLNNFCSILSKEEIFKTAQSARNSIGKLTEKGLINKKRINKIYTLSIPEDLFLDTASSILLEYKFLAIDP